MSRFKAKMLQIRFLASVRLSLCLFLIDGVWHLAIIQDSHAGREFKETTLNFKTPTKVVDWEESQLKSLQFSWSRWDASSESGSEVFGNLLMIYKCDSRSRWNGEISQMSRLTPWLSWSFDLTFVWLTPKLLWTLFFWSVVPKNVKKYNLFKYLRNCLNIFSNVAHDVLLRESEIRNPLITWTPICQTASAWP